MKESFLFVLLFIAQNLSAQNSSKIYIGESRPSELYCEADNINGSTLMITKTSGEWLYKIAVVTTEDSVKNITEFPAQKMNDEILIKGIAQDINHFFVFFQTDAEISVLVVDKSLLSTRWVVYPTVIDNKKERLVYSFTLKDKYYALVGNKKTDEISFYQFTVTTDSLQKKTIKLKGEKNEYDLLNGNYYLSKLNGENSVYESFPLNKIFERDNDRLLLIAENQRLERLTRGTYFFEYDFNDLTVKQNKLADDFTTPVTKQIGKSMFIDDNYSVNSFIYGNKFYKIWLSDSLLIKIYNLNDLSLSKQMSFNDKTLIKEISDGCRLVAQNGSLMGIFSLDKLLSKKKDSANLTDGKHILKQLKKGSPVICVNGKGENVILQVGTKILEYSNGGGGFMRGGMTTISTPGGPASIPGAPIFVPGGRYVSGENIKYFNLVFDRPVTREYIPVFEKINDFVNNADDDFKKLEDYPNSIYKLGDNYILAFLYKKTFYRFIF